MAYSTSTLAQGCFGKVYKQKYNDTWAAIKKVPQHLIDRKDLERECAVYNKCNHPNIVKLLGNITLTGGKWIIPLEFVFGEDLETTIFTAAKSKIKLTPENKGTIIVGMCEGLYHLHCKDIVHQDLKPENIMVEHGTNRAVIIDLGLAKFFRHGLNSAIDMGNEAYAAPEVLKCGIQRDQRSDVWAMGKIIAELLARIRLYTPSVCPSKIKETLRDQPYCTAVCRMVDSDPSLRSSMGGVIHEIRLAGGKGIVVDTPVKTDHLKLPSPNIDRRHRSPSPRNRGPSPLRNNPSPVHRPSPPATRNPAPIGRSPSPFNLSPSPLRKATDFTPHQPTPPLLWERSPRPEIKPLSPRYGQHHSPLPGRAEDQKFKPTQLPKDSLEIARNIRDLKKMQLYEEATKELPCDLPTTGRVVVRCYREKNGDIEKWEQKEVVTRDGKIVQYNDVQFNSN